jgi:hypothetical protein
METHAQVRRCSDGGVPPDVAILALVGCGTGEKCRYAMEVVHDRLHVGARSEAQDKKDGRDSPICPPSPDELRKA